MAVDVSSAGALRRRVELQQRLWQATHTTFHRAGKKASAKQLYREILGYLLKARDQKLLREAPDVIRKHLRYLEPDPHGYFDIAVGTVRNFARTKELPHFTRTDGGWFDFQLQGRERDGSVDIMAYDFELRLPPKSGFDFLRFDLNPPGHENEDEDEGLRSHLHLNADDDGLAAPAPVMSPYEILDLFLHGLCRMGRVRRSPAIVTTGG